MEAAERLKQLAGQALERLMSDISEDCYAAGWNSGLEYDLWRIMRGDSRDYGMCTITDEQIEELRQLSIDCGGWHNGNEVVPLADWKREFARYWENDYLPMCRKHLVWVTGRIGTLDCLKRETTQEQADKYAAELAASEAELPKIIEESQPAPVGQYQSDCGCARCLSLRPADPRSAMMIVCPTCGNKRCPKATAHWLCCTGSNASGQAGSDFGDSPAPPASPT